MVKKINNFLFKINRITKRVLIKHSNDNRPASYPYISGDSFRKIAKHIFDETSNINHKNIKSGDIIFVRSDYIKKFFNEIHPFIKNKYKLITHNADTNINSDFVKYIDDKIIHWYAQNVDVVHPKITPIPIGLENLHHYVNGITSIFERVKNKNNQKENKIFFGFNVSTNPKERQLALETLTKITTAEKISDWPNPKEYINLLSKYKFIASPSGNGIDCHRNWESMYLDVVPIVTRSVTMNYFEKLKLPMFVIDNWNEIKNLNEEDLKNKFENVKNNSDTKPLYMDYWISKVTNSY